MLIDFTYVLVRRLVLGLSSRDLFTASTLEAGPELGNAYVLEEVLGYDGKRIVGMFASLAMQ